MVIERRATVTGIDVVEGAEVHQGQQLLTAYTIGDSGAIGTATNQLRADELDLESARVRDGAGALNTIKLQAKVANDRQALTDLKATPLAVTAPVDGRVSGLSVAVGAEVTRTDVVLHVVDTRTLRVTVPVATSYRNLITTGQQASLTLPGGSGQAYPAAVTSVGPSTVNAATALDTIPVTVELPNPPETIALGSGAYVSFPINRNAAVAVNSLAVLGKDQQPFVFLLQDGQVHQRPVTVGVTDGKSTEIVKGLARGDQVVISGGQQLVSGDRVSAARSDAS